MSCSVCGLFFAPGETDSFQAHRRFHGAFNVLAAREAAGLPSTRVVIGCAEVDHVAAGSATADVHVPGGDAPED